MTELVYPPVETDPDELLRAFVAYLQDQWPDWEPIETELDYVIGQAVSHAAAEVADVAADVPLAIFRYFGQNVVGLQPVEAEAAAVASTWTLIDAAGHAIPAGTEVGVPAGDGGHEAFAVAEDVVVPPGASATGPGEVRLEAVEAGEAANGLSGTPVLLTPLAFVVEPGGVALVGQTADGADAEEDEAYLGRLARRLQLMAPRPILPSDFAALALDQLPAGSRATAIDLYDPGPPEDFAAERTVTVAIVGADGEAFDAPTRAATSAALEAMREQNFVVPVIDPAYTTVDVHFDAVALPDRDAADVEARAEAAVEAALSPATWGGSELDPDQWRNVPTVRRDDLVATVKGVEGLDHLVSLTLRKGAGPFAAADVALDGPAPLPRPGDVAGTVTPP